MTVPPLVVLLARWPRRGRVKTRLEPALGPDLALRLHVAMVADARARLERLAAAGWAVRVLWEDGSRPGEDLRRHLAGHPREGLQEGPDLGATMRAALSGGWAEGREACFVLGTDSPTLPDTRLHEARQAAALDDLVIGPADDGGYYLVGARRAVPGIFDGIPWGTSAVLPRTLAAARTAGARVHLLRNHYDVDRPGDLARLREELAEPGGHAAAVAPCTRRVLQEMDPW